MSYLDRKEEILEFLAKSKNKSASVKELSKSLYISEATVRRDLDHLQRDGLLERSHGGAVLMERADEFSIFIRQTKNVKEKMRAGGVALKRLPDFQTVFIDNSSTCLALAEKMNFSRRTVVTNGLHLALEIARKDGVTIISPGGEIKQNTTAVTGSKALSEIANLRFDLCLLSCAGIDEKGCYELSVDSAEIKKAAFENSKIRILVVDSTKIGCTAPYRSTSVREYDFIFTDADDQALSALRAINPNVINQ